VENDSKHITKGKQMKRTQTYRSNKRKRKIKREFLADIEAGKKRRMEN